VSGDDILQKIVAVKRDEIAAARKRRSLASLRADAESAERRADPHQLVVALVVGVVRAFDLGPVDDAVEAGHGATPGVVQRPASASTTLRE